VVVLNPLGVRAVLEEVLLALHYKAAMVKEIILVVLRLVVVVMVVGMLLHLQAAVLAVAFMAVAAVVLTAQVAGALGMLDKQLAQQIQQELIPQVQLVVL
jgi:hypothetical protein